MEKDLDRIIAEYLAGEGIPDETAWLEGQMQSSPEIRGMVEELKLLLEVDDFMQGKMEGVAQKQFEHRLQEDPATQSALKGYQETEVFMELEKRRRALELMESFEQNKKNHLRSYISRILPFLTLAVISIAGLMLYRSIYSPKSNIDVPIAPIEGDPGQGDQGEDDQGKGGPVEGNQGQGNAPQVLKEDKKNTTSSTNEQKIANFVAKELAQEVQFDSQMGNGTPNDTIRVKWIADFKTSDYKNVRSLLTESYIDNLPSLDRQLEARFALGLTYCHSDDFNKANEIFTQILNSKPSNWKEKARWYSALCYLKTKNLNEAKKLINEILTKNSHFKKTKAEEIKPLLPAE